MVQGPLGRIYRDSGEVPEEETGQKDSPVCRHSGTPVSPPTNTRSYFLPPNTRIYLETSKSDSRNDSPFLGPPISSPTPRGKRESTVRIVGCGELGNRIVVGVFGRFSVSTDGTDRVGCLESKVGVFHGSGTQISFRGRRRPTHLSSLP